MGIFDYFKKKKSLIGNYEVIQRVIPLFDENLSDQEFFEKVRTEANIEFANGGLEKVPSEKEIKELVTLVKLSQSKS